MFYSYGSGAVDILFSPGIIVEGSVDQTMKGKHYQNGVRCVKLIREDLIQTCIKELISLFKTTRKLKDYLKTLRSGLKEALLINLSMEIWRMT